MLLEGSVFIDIAAIKRLLERDSTVGLGFFWFCLVLFLVFFPFGSFLCVRFKSVFGC